MAQISYGTITITDTNDVESIVVEYNRNKSTTTPPAQTDSGWSTNRPTWAQDYYIWQRTRTHKSGTQASEDTLGNAVCITGSTGQSGTPGKGITGIETLYATNNSTTTAPTSASEWQPQPPTYNSSKPKYWVKVTTTYSVGEPTVVTYLDNGITDAMATAAAANSSATEALSKTQAKYATSSTEATIPAKVAVFNPAVTTWSLFNGAEIFVKFTNENNVANPTLSVKPSSSGSGTAAKTIRDSDGNALDSKFYWGANSLVHFVYDGTYWRILDIVTTAKYNSMVSDIDGITQTVGKIELHDISQYATSSTIASTQNKVATITPAVTGWELYTGATITVKFTNANTHATPNLNINNTGAKGIRTYSGGTLSEGEYKWKAGDVFTFTYNGTYWLMQDSMTRLRGNETIIQQTANNVLIKATENDTTAAQGGQHLIESLINVAPDGITIDADKVNIEGATIFTSGRLSSESLNNTYDLKGAANSIEIGGKNILTKSETMDGWYKGSGTTIVDGVATITGNASNWNSVLCSSKYDISVYDGSEYIWSFEYKSTADCYIVKNISATGATVDSISYARTKFTYWNSNATLPSSGGEWKKFVLPSRTISLSDLTEGSGSTVSGFLQLYNRTTGVVLQVRHMKLEKGNKATDWSPAPEDMVAQEQRIYYRTDATTPPDAPSSWISSVNTVNNDWTTKRMEYNQTYPYLFTCIQRLNIGGAISHTDVLLDDTTTVIDGGHIITGTVDANQIAANAITASKIATDAIHSRAYDSGTGIYSTEGMGIDLTGNGSIKSPNFAIDENGNAYFNGQLTATSLVIAPGAVVEGDASQMLSDAYAPSLTKIDAKYNRYFSDATNASTECSFVSAGNEVLPDPNANYFVRIKNTELNKYRALCFYGSANYENAIGMVVGDTYKVSCWVRQLEGSSNFLINLGGLGGAQYTDTTFVPTAEWQKYEKVFTFSDLNEATSTVWSRLYFYNRAGAEINGAGTGIGQIDMCGFKLERVNAITASGRNLCLRSADYNGWDKINGTTFNGNVITFPAVTSDVWREARQGINLPYSIARNQKVTITYKVKGTAEQLIGIYTELALVASESSNSPLKYVDKYHYINATGGWQSVAMSVYINDYIFISGSGSPNFETCYLNFRVGAINSAHNGFQMKEIMVALGSDPCAWSPAPEDSVIYTDESIDSLEIGGRNLAKGTSDEWYSSVITDGQNRNVNLFGLANVHEPLYIEDIPDIKVGDKIQVSFDIKFSENWVATGTGTKNSIVQGNKNHNSTPWTSISYTGGNKKTELETIMASTSKEGHITTWFLVTQDMIDGTYSGQLMSNVRFDYYSGTVSVRRIMVEKGDKATTWAPAPEDETNARRLLIREITSGDTQGIEVGYENGSYKAFINAAGSFDVINAAGETVASFSETSTMRSVRTETWDVNGAESEVEVEAWQQLTPDGTQFYKREHSIDEDFYYNKSQSTIIDGYGIRPQGPGAIFELGRQVVGPNETKLWHMKTSNSAYIIEGKWFGAGYITTQKKKVNFTIPLCIPIVEGEGITVSCHDDNGMDLVIRQNNKYIFGSADGPENIESEYVSISTCPSGVNVSIDFPSALSDAINNDAVGISCDYFIKVDDGEHYYHTL